MIIEEVINFIGIIFYTAINNKKKLINKYDYKLSELKDKFSLHQDKRKYVNFIYGWEYFEKKHNMENQY